MRQFYKDSDGAIAFETSAPLGYSLVTGVEKELLWRAKYEERKEDGENYYTENQASLYISVLEGVYTSAQVFEFESHINELSSLIIGGNWLTAQDFISTIPLLGIFDITKKTEITTYIDNYVANNY